MSQLPSYENPSGDPVVEQMISVLSQAGRGFEYESVTGALVTGLVIDAHHNHGFSVVRLEEFNGFNHRKLFGVRGLLLGTFLDDHRQRSEHEPEVESGILRPFRDLAIRRFKRDGGNLASIASPTSLGIVIN